MRIPDHVIPNLISILKAGRLRMALQRHPSLERGWSNPKHFSTLLEGMEARTGFVVSAFLHGQWIDQSALSGFCGEDMVSCLLEAKVMLPVHGDQLHTNGFVVKVWRDNFFIEPIPPHYHTSDFFFDPIEFMGVYPQMDIFLTCLKDLIGSEDRRILDINPGCGALSLLLAKDTGMDVSVLAQNQRAREFIQTNTTLSGSPSLSLLNEEGAKQNWDIVFEMSNWRPGPDHGRFNPYFRHGVQFDFKECLERLARLKPRKAIVYYESLGTANALSQYEEQCCLAKAMGAKITSHVLRKFPVQDYLQQDWVILNNNLYRLQPPDMFQEVADRWAAGLTEGENATVYCRCDCIEYASATPGLTILPIYNPMNTTIITQHANKLLRS